MGTTLPSDYKSLVDQYGHGSFTGGTYICSFLGFVGFAATCASVLADDEWFHIPTYPANPGFLPFGMCHDRDTIGWYTNDGNPNDWPIFYYCPQKKAPNFYDLSNMGVSDFVLSTLNRNSILFEHRVLESKYYQPPFQFYSEILS